MNYCKRHSFWWSQMAFLKGNKSISCNEKSTGDTVKLLEENWDLVPTSIVSTHFASKAVNSTTMQNNGNFCQSQNLINDMQHHWLMRAASQRQSGNQALWSWDHQLSTNSFELEQCEVWLAKRTQSNLDLASWSKGVKSADARIANFDCLRPETSRNILIKPLALWVTIGVLGAYNLLKSG